MDQLSGQDAQFLYMESDSNPTHITSISIFDPAACGKSKTVRFEDILGHVKSRLHLNPAFRRRLVRVPFELDFPYWVDDKFFDLEYHVQHGRLPEPCDWRQFCLHMGRYHSRPLDMSLPLWEMYVVEGLDNIKGLPKGCFAVATKIHHAAADALSMSEFLSALLDIDSEGTPVNPLNSAKLNRSPTPSLLDMGVRAVWHTVRSPVGMIDAVMRAAPNLYSLAEDLLLSSSEQTHPVPDTRFNDSVSPSKSFDALAVALDDLKLIRRAIPGSTINDVVLAICGGGLRKYLLRHDELPEDPLVAWVPISARRSAGKEDSGNKLTCMTVPIYTDVEDPVERLKQVMIATEMSKAAKAGVSARVLTDISQHVPAATQVLASRLVLRTGATARMCNLFISNVPGPQLPLYMNGAEQIGFYGMAPLVNGMGLFIATPSYNGHITFNVTSTREVIPDMRFFIGCLKKSLSELKRAAKPVKPATKRQPVKRAKKRPKANGDQPAALDDQSPEVSR
jgi:WS/DGAT/MGAT family acyltransferase